MNGHGQLGPGWTVVLRRRPVRMVEGRPEGGYTDEFEIICCYCGDDPSLDCREISSALQEIRGPYPIATGITAYVQHARRHPRPQGMHPSGHCPVREADGCLPAADSSGPGLGQLGPSSMSSRVEQAETSRRGLTPVERR